MRKLDQRGIAAFEMTLVFVPLFTLMFVIFDLGRYAITQQSLNALAHASARAIMIGCYTNDVTSSPKVSPSSNCTIPCYQPSSSAPVAATVPFLYFGGLTPTVCVSVTAGANALTVTAQQLGFAMLMPIWGGALDAPSASTTVPF
jgi:Flp pilus assembly protein TadG